MEGANDQNGTLKGQVDALEGALTAHSAELREVETWRSVYPGSRHSPLALFT